MRIACTDSTVAARVRTLLARYGIVRDVVAVGPFTGDPTAWVVVNVAIARTTEPAIRRDLASIPGATAHE
jgi:hypothetical protein